MAELSINDKAQLLDALADFSQLWALDSLWTEYLRDRPSIPGEDRGVIHRVGSQMDALLSRCEGHAQLLNRLSQTHGDKLEQGIRQLQSGTLSAASGVAISQQARDALTHALDRRGGLARAADSATSHFSQIVPSERRELSTKLGEVSAGHSTSGDLTKECVCSLAVNMVIGGVLASETGVGAFVGLAGIVILAASEAAGNPC